MRLRVATYNIHKGVMGLRNSSLRIHGLRENIHQMNADLVLLQEVQGRHDGFSRRFHNWPEDAQHEFLAHAPSTMDGVLGHASRRYFSAYGMNAVYPDGHHGNALLSAYPIEGVHNEDVSDHRLEKRGLLHCWLQSPVGRLDVVVVHFGLFAGSRARQARKLVEYVAHAVPAQGPLIVAGDFNDWQRSLGGIVQKGIQGQEVFPAKGGQRLVRVGSFPSRLPVLGLDRVFTRGFQALDAQVLHGQPWRKLSDHAPFLVDLEVQRV